MDTSSITKVVCGQCTQQFDSFEAELAHICPTTGVPPTDPLTMGVNYAAIQQAALERGEAEAVNSPEPVEGEVIESSPAAEPQPSATVEPQVIEFS